MRTKLKFLICSLLMIGLLSACEEDEKTKEVTLENGGEVNGTYFPAAGNGEWKTASAEELNWNTDALNEAIAFARDNRSYNLLILHKGKIVVEEYWQGTNSSTQHKVNSIEKSMMSFVIGDLVDDGRLSIDDKVSDHIPAGWSDSPETEADITIKHLLTMTSGLNIDLGYAARPGEMWRYNHFAYKVLYEVIKAVTGGSARDYFNKEFFAKMGMTNYSWEGYDLSVSARELTRFGLLASNRGEWLGNKLVTDEGYLSNMLAASQPFQPAYGYLWWLNGTDSWYNADISGYVDGSIVPTMPSDGYLAKGFHDQRIYFVPSLELVVIRQGEHTGLPEAGAGSFDEGFWERLMRAVRNNASSTGS
jgi:CubicO group peptidase (beta-lactamase class C family)